MARPAALHRRRVSRARSRSRLEVRIPALPRLWTGADIREWLRANPLVAPTLLAALAALMYMFQVNGAAMLDYRLQSLVEAQARASGQYAQAAAEMDRLSSCSRVCAIATRRFRMDQPVLTSALWLTVRLPSSLPVLPKEPAVRTGSLVWLRQAERAIGDSL